MPLFGKPRRVEFVAAPAESPVDELLVEARVVEVDEKLRAIAEIPRADRPPNLWWQLDVLLDRRNAIRPGRSS